MRSLAKRILTNSAIISGLTFGHAAMANAQEIPIETLAKLPSVSSLSLSRDGDYLVGLIGKDGDDVLSLAVWDTADFSKPPKMVKPSGGVEFLGAQALKAGKIQVFSRKKWSGSLAGCGEGKAIGSTKTYLTKTLVTDINLSEFSEPFGYQGKKRDMSEAEKICSAIVGTGQLVSTLPLDPDHVVIAQSTGVYDRSVDYFKYNLKTGEKDKLFTNMDTSKEGFSLLHPKTSEILAKNFSDYGDGRYKQKTKIVTADGSFKTQEKLTSDTKSRHNVNIIGRNDNTGKYFVSTDQFSDKIRIYMYDANTESFDSSPLYSHPEFNIGGIIRSSSERDFGKVLGYTVMGADIETVYLDPVLKAAQSKFLRQYPGKNVTISDWSQDRTKMIVTVDGSDMPPAYFLTTDGKAFKFLGTRIPELAKTSLPKTELVYYNARDGKKIPGLLTMPRGWKKGDAAPPAIVHPHGGPWARDYAGWDSSGWVPFLTSRGYAVLQPQYRGSTGWGRDIWLSGDFEWGQKMQDDKDDGAQWMIENGYANPDRIAIFGYSYGGFAAFAAVVRPDGPYKCAIAGAGVSDLTQTKRLDSRNRLQRAFQGRTLKGMDPMNNTDKASIPILSFHGDRDVRVPDTESKNFHKKVKDKVNSKLVIIKDQPHSLPWTEKMQVTALKAIEDFLENDCFNG